MSKTLLIILTLLALCFNSKSWAQCTDLNTSFSVNQTAFCGTLPQTLTLTNSSSGSSSSGATYDWYMDGALFATTTGLSNPPNFPLTSNGSHEVMVVGTSLTACEDTSRLQIEVAPVPVADFTFSPDNECAQRNVSFNNTSTNTVHSLTTYAWDFGDGNTSSLKDPTYQYNAGGNYTITLTVTNTTGCSSTYSAPIVVKDIPVMSGITGDGGDGTAINCLSPVDPQTTYTVNFANNTTGAVSYFWDFDDGNTSNAANPTHTFASYGTYHVTLVTTGPNGCTISDTMNVVFEKFVSASLHLDLVEYSGCAPLTLTTLQNNSNNANVYVWDFGDGTPAVTTTSSTPPIHSYTEGGTYTISLTASNSCNNAFATIGPIIVVGKPDVNFSVNGNNGCAPKNLSFTNSTTGASPANAYQWDMGNGNIYNNTITPPAQTYTDAGTYTVSLTASNACGDSTLTQTFTLDTIPIAAIDVVPNEGCSPLTVDVYNHSVGNINYYHWYRDGTYYSSAQNIGPFTYSYPPGNSPVTRNISLTVGNGCGSTSDAETIIIHRPTKADFQISDSTVCLGTPITFTNSSLGENLTFQWDFGNGNSSTANGPHTITYTSPGTYSVQLIASGYCGNDTLTMDVTVYPIPVADFSPTLSSGCEDFQATFINNSTATAQQNWIFGSGATPTTSTNYDPGSILYSTPGTHQVILTVSENGCVDKDTNYITVFPLPDVQFTLTPTEGCSELNVSISNTSANTGVEVFSWDFGNGNTFVGFLPPSQNYTATATDQIYTVQLTVQSGDGCFDSLQRQVTVHPLPTADFDFVEDTICMNEAMSVHNNSVLGAAYFWDFGDGTSSTQYQPTHIFSTPGTHAVQLIVETAFGCADTVVKQMEILPIPQAQFIANTVCFGDATTFTDQSMGTIATWQWDFGDGSSSTQQNPVHTYSTAGTFSAQLTVTNAIGCTTTFSQNVTVNDVPIAAFSSANFCMNDATVFTNQTVGNTIGMEWNFDDGSAINTTTSPTHTFPNSGSYDVQLIAIGGSGCADTISQTVVIHPIPTANFSTIATCSGDTTYFTDQSLGNPDTYTWDFDDPGIPNSTSKNPKIVYQTAGTHAVTLTVEYAATGCANSITIPVEAHPHTTPQFTATTACFNNSTVFSNATTGNPISWEWNFNDGSTLNTTQNPQHIFPSAGTFNVSLVTENVFGCSDTLTQAVVVHPLPVAGFTFDSVCLHATTHFTDTSQQSVAWEYDFGDGSIALNQHPTHTYLTAGTFSVQQVVTNIFGCKDTAVAFVVVHPNPVAQFSADTACFSFPTTFVNTSTAFVSVYWEFSDGNATSTTISPTFVYSSDGIFSPQLKVTNVFGCSDSITKDVLVQVQPEAGFTNTTVCAGDIVSFTDASTGNPNQFQWGFGDGSAGSSTQNNTHVFGVGGLYTVSLRVENASGCSDTLHKTIEVYTVPIVDFAADTVCLFNVTHFQDLSTDAVPIQSWDWDFGDGNTSPNQNPTYIYQNSGTYSVSLTVTNIHGCHATFNQDAIVIATPHADFSFVTDCFFAPTLFTDQSTNNPGIYIWDFGDGTVLNGGANEQHTYNLPGSYTVTLKVKGTQGVCGDSISKVVTISPGATADFLIPSQVCVNDVFNFYNNSSTAVGNIVSYQWDMGDNTFYSTENGTHAYASPGVYNVSLHVTTSNGCAASYDTTIDVLPATTAHFDWENVCLNTPTQFTNTSTGGTTSWYWDFGDGTTNQTQFPVHSFPQAGNYDVQLIVQNLAGCADTVMQTVTIYPAPAPDFTFNEVCFGDSTQFVNQTTLTTGSVSNYHWSFGVGEDTSNVENPSYVFQTYEQEHQVTLIAVSNIGCSDTITKQVSLLPIVDFNINIDNHFGCTPFTVVFDNQSELNGASVLDYLWDFGNGDTSFQQSPTHTFSEEGVYPVQLTVYTSTDCAIPLQDSLIIQVFPSPMAGFALSPTITTISTPIVEVADASVGASMWEYDLSDGNYSNLPSFSHQFKDTGVFYITQYVKNDYGCMDTISRAVRMLSDFTLYVPNAFTPDDANGANDAFTWVIDGAKTFELFIFNRWGEVVYHTQDPKGKWDGYYAGKPAKDGVYIWKVKAMDMTGEEHVVVGHVSVLK